MKWLIEQEALDDVRAIFSQDFTPAMISQLSNNSDPKDEVFVVQDGIAHVGINGPLMARPNPIMRFFGMNHTGYSEVLEALAIADADPKVKSVQLNVNSPGGQASGLFAVTDAIKSLTKPVVAVADYAASAAYAIAAATGRIEARGPASTFGSIGVAAEFAVDEKVVTITSTESPDKRPDVTTEEGRAVIRSQLDAIHELFVSTIADTRGTSASEVNEKFGRGRTFLAGEARSRGMIDDIQGGASVGSDSDSQSANAEKENKMDLKTLKADHPDVFSAACEEAVTEERDRVAAHLQMGDTSGDMKTAIGAVLDGSGMTQKLQAEYMSAGMKRRDVENRESDDAEAGDALKGKAESSTGDGDGESDVTAFDKEFAASLSELRGVDVSC